jgi:hypothetical protein
MTDNAIPRAGNPARGLYPRTAAKLWQRKVFIIRQYQTFAGAFGLIVLMSLTVIWFGVHR